MKETPSARHSAGIVEDHPFSQSLPPLPNLITNMDDVTVGEESKKGSSILHLLASTG